MILVKPRVNIYYDYCIFLTDYVRKVIYILKIPLALYSDVTGTLKIFTDMNMNRRLQPLQNEAIEKHSQRVGVDTEPRQDVKVFALRCSHLDSRTNRRDYVLGH